MLWFNSRNMRIAGDDQPAASEEKFLTVDASGRLQLPAELVRKYGFAPGERVYFKTDADDIRLQRSIGRLARIYVEPTTRCNMDCDMCQRRAWPYGSADMRRDVFEKILEALEQADPVPTVVFGGFGEPLMHPDLMTFVAECRLRGAKVELISNGLLLDKHIISRMMDLNLDRLWVSMDGTSESCAGHIRNRGAFRRLIDHLKLIAGGRYYGGSGFRPSLGFVFVAMRDNIQEFPDVIQLARSLGVDRVLVSNLLPHTKEGLDQILYSRLTWRTDDRLFQINLPRLDLRGPAMDIILKTMGHQDMADLVPGPPAAQGDCCPFIKKGSLCVSWDGGVSPCLPLLHTHTCHFQDIRRTNRRHRFGSLTGQSLFDVWNNRAYKAFREKVMAFDFSPCVSCASCEWAEANEEDCIGSAFPTCGGCLWAQGLIQCP